MKKEYITPEVEMIKFVEAEEIMNEFIPPTTSIGFTDMLEGWQ